MSEVVEHKTQLEGIAIKIDAHGKAAIENILTVGKLLCDARELLPADQAFGKWKSERLPWIKKDLSSRWMNAYRNGGLNLVSHNAKPTVLYELTAPSVPESAREEAEEHESLTVKQSKEIVKANKRIEELEKQSEPRPPDKDNLIPGLQKLYKGASITPRRANQLSVLDDVYQKIYLNEFHQKSVLTKQVDDLKDEKTKLSKTSLEAIAEKEKALSQLEEATGKDEATLILEHEDDLDRLKKQYDKDVFDMRKEISKEASELHEKRFKDQIETANNAKDKAEKAKEEAKEKATAAYKRQTALEHEKETLEKQLEVDNPTNVDNVRVKHIEDAGRGLLVSFNELRKDLDKIGGGMENSLSIAEEVLKKASLKLAELQGFQDAVINV